MPPPRLILRALNGIRPDVVLFYNSARHLDPYVPETDLAHRVDVARSVDHSDIVAFVVVTYPAKCRTHGLDERDQLFVAV